jgi:predicted phosphate transport protein (TIGR00153 family)
MGLRRLLSPLVRREREIFVDLLSFGETVRGAVSSLVELLDAVSVYDSELASVKYREVLEREVAADFLRRRISEAIATGSFFSNLRELLLELSERLDLVADYSKSAARSLHYLSPPSPTLIRLLTSEAFARYKESLRNCVDSLFATLRVMGSGGSVELEALHMVEKWEEEADEQKDDLMDLLYGLRHGMDASEFMLLREFVLILDNICDAAEDTSDVILVMLATVYR